MTTADPFISIQVIPDHSPHEHGHCHEHVLTKGPSLWKLIKEAYKYNHRMFYWILLYTFMSLGVWFYGHHAESLAITAYAYYLIFDTLGMLHLIYSQTIRHQSYYTKSTLLYPFGRLRTEVLFSFSNIIYLLFIAIYVVKEGLEHVILTDHYQHQKT
jgi:Co/Zn/Cd efflux system component